MRDLLPNFIRRQRFEKITAAKGTVGVHGVFRVRGEIDDIDLRKTPPQPVRERDPVTVEQLNVQKGDVDIVRRAENRSIWRSAASYSEWS